MFVVGNNLGTGWGQSVDMGSQGIDFVDFVVECMGLLMQTCVCQRGCSLVVCSLVLTPAVACELVPWELVVFFVSIPLLLYVAVWWWSLRRGLVFELRGSVSQVG